MALRVGDGTACGALGRGLMSPRRNVRQRGAAAPGASARCLFSLVWSGTCGPNYSAKDRANESAVCERKRPETQVLPPLTGSANGASGPCQGIDAPRGASAMRLKSPRGTAEAARELEP